MFTVTVVQRDPCTDETVTGKRTRQSQKQGTHTGGPTQFSTLA